MHWAKSHLFYESVSSSVKWNTDAYLAGMLLDFNEMTATGTQDGNLYIIGTPPRPFCLIVPALSPP